MGVVLGLESGPALRQLVRAGMDEGLAEDLLGACEQGMIAALNEKDDQDGDEGNRDQTVGQGQGTGRTGA
ncbi:MAG TPA: hypothetical protein VGN60_00765 [Devosia sp.]|nr:hypothetical protein [Devosia sp.]